ncbi:MAG: hypothetical protein ACXWNK_13190 [Vulcanimicrobiaceae bacterium]
MKRLRVGYTILFVLMCLAATMSVQYRSFAATPWLGITLGEPFAKVYALLGDPWQQQPANHANGQAYYYKLKNAQLDITTYNGRVIELMLMRDNNDPDIPDPKGVHIGGNKAVLDRAWGKPTYQQEREGLIRAYYADGDAVWEYEMDDNSGLAVKRGTVLDIKAFLSARALGGLAPVALPKIHSGDSASDALVPATIVGALPLNEYEQTYFHDRPCHRMTLPGLSHEVPIYDAKWMLVGVKTVTQDGGQYDVVTSRCIGGRSKTPQVFEQRELYFKRG